MSNLFQGIQSGFAELKNFYQGPMVDLFSEDMPVLRGAEKVKSGWSGYQVIRPLRTNRNQGIGATSDGGQLPVIGRQGTQQAIISSKYNYLRFGVTGPMIKASASNVGSFVRSAAYELEMGYKDLKSDLNRQYSWSGTGVLATVSANVVASTSITITGRESVEQALKFVDIGLNFDIYSSNSTSATPVQHNLTVVSISSGTPESASATIVVDQPVTCSANNVLVRANSFGNEVQGLLTSLDGGTSTIYNINRATTLQYQGNSLAAGGAVFSLDAIQNIMNRAIRRGGGKLSAFFCDFDTQRMYQKLLTADKRYVNSMQGDGGFASKTESYLQFDGIPIVADKDCPQRLFALAPDSWKNYVLADLEFADETGSMYIAQVSADAFEVRIRYFSNLFPESPAANGVYSGYVSP